MNPLWLIPIGIVAVNILIAIAFHERGHRLGRKAGHDEGYELGRIAANNWWLGSEREIEATRRQIWKEEAQL